PGRREAGLSRCELLVDGDVLDVPGPAAVAGVATRAPGGAGRGVWRGEHDHAYSLAPVGAAQPLAVDKARLLAGPRDHVLAQMTGGLVGPFGIDGHPYHHRVHVNLLLSAWALHARDGIGAGPIPAS